MSCDGKDWEWGRGQRQVRLPGQTSRVRDCANAGQALILGGDEEAGGDKVGQ